MNLYLDSSALLKRYLREPGTDEVLSWMERARSKGTVTITRAEISSAIRRTLRMKQIESEDAARAIKLFRMEWEGFIRVSITDQLVNRADHLAFDLGLRGYDAVHLAAALAWQESLGQPVTMATFDKELKAGAKKMALEIYPS
jgi:predicted nucleic acid-binding protein